ncbi:hypothetical protein [Speluncibacter jeojiensis]|uniref:Zinc-binding dehydrogenase n=1 Tax=Speluncibacter jeojiensis TaxID=2710754 RepID=A0A9X4RBV6_9ACTN|nr:hypothetical protein [Corynebacteriales bacterium D3-21]
MSTTSNPFWPSSCPNDLMYGRSRGAPPPLRARDGSRHAGPDTGEVAARGARPGRGVNSALHDTIAGAAGLDALRPMFESGDLEPPVNVFARPLSAAVETYRDLAAGAPGKFVLVPEA